MGFIDLFFSVRRLRDPPASVFIICGGACLGPLIIVITLENNDCGGEVDDCC